MLRHTPVTRRAGFTLIELLIVIAVIAIIVALVTAAIMRTTATATEAGDVADIKKSEEAVGKFFAKYQCYPPDKVKLCHYLADYNMANPLDAESVAILNKIWPQVFKFAVSSSSAAPYNTPIPWASYDLTTWTMNKLPQHPITLQNCVVLEGDQCLVFFLGGPQGTRGFTDSTTFPIHDYGNPVFKGQKPARVAFYDFPVERLQRFDYQLNVLFPARYTTPTTALDPFNPPSTGNAFPSFVDNYKMNYFVYFSSNTAPGMKKGYNYLFSRAIAGLDGPGPPKVAVSPYYESLNANGVATNYVNPETFQIICAGVDHKFGPLGGPWQNGKYLGAGVAGTDWFDNHANFHPNRLGDTR
jgi:prepilin-type N-terminal cleavage/methylation domain-containing protein